MFRFRPECRCIIVIILLQIVGIYSQSSVFLVNPESIIAVDGITVQFTCTANNTEDIVYRVNGTSASSLDIQNKGFEQLGAEGMGTIRRNLSVSVSSLYNNTEILCRAVGIDNNINSNTAILTVQGSLSSVGGLSYSFINSSTVIITWSPPFTLHGTNIIGYNISVAINGSNSVSLFTMESCYEFILTSVTNSPCDQISITVAGYNGLDGDTNTLTEVYLPAVPSSDDTVIPVTVSINDTLSLSITMDVTGLCIGQRPTVIDVLLLSLSNGTLLDKVNDIMLPVNNQLNSITVNNVSTLVEDIQYIILLVYSNLAGDFNTYGHENLNTIGIESVTITDSSNGRVCIECIFTLFSTDTGCTVELISSNSYTYTFTRSSNNATATGCISNVTTGLYTIRVYGQGSSIIVYSMTELNVTEQPGIINTISITGMITMNPIATDAITTPTDTNTPTELILENDERDFSSSAVIFLLVGLVSGIVLTLFILSVIFIFVIAYRKYKSNSNNKSSSADVVIMTDTNPAYGEIRNNPTRLSTNTTVLYDNIQLS